MTKSEQILEEKIKQNLADAHGESIAQCLEAMKELSIRFGEWLPNNNWIKIRGGWINISNSNSFKTTADLFKIFDEETNLKKEV